jgi:hypothetical protein
MPEEAAPTRIVLMGVRPDGLPPGSADPVRRIVLGDYSPSYEAARAAHPSSRTSRN